MAVYCLLFFKRSFTETVVFAEFLFCEFIFTVRKCCDVFYRPGAAVRASVSDQLCYFIEELYGAGDNT